MEYASGSLDEGMSLLVASHMTFCPCCRRVAEAEEAIGGALLCSQPPAAETPDFASVLARIERPSSSDATEEDDPDSPLPRPLRRAVGARFSQIHWSPRLPGLAEHVIQERPGPDGRQVRVSLVRAKPGLRIPAHTHGGDEATLILCGAMEDEGVIYRRGDVSLSDDNHDHHPRILPEGTCVCLFVLTGGLRFTGPFSRALNLLS